MKKILFIVLFLFIFSGLSFASDNSENVKGKVYYLTDWKKIHGLGLFYQRNGVLIEYRFEKALRHSNSLGYGIGYFENWNYRINGWFVRFFNKH